MGKDSSIVAPAAITPTNNINATAAIPSFSSEFDSAATPASYLLCTKCCCKTSLTSLKSSPVNNKQQLEIVESVIVCACVTSSSSSIPSSLDFSVSDVGSLPNKHWSKDTEKFKLRSATYLQDKKKSVSTESLFELIAMDLLEVDQPKSNVAINLEGGVAHQYLARPGPKPYLFIVHFQLPGDKNLAFIAYFAAKAGALEADSPSAKLFHSFITGTDAFRQSRFKFIPLVSQGPYLVRSMVGSTPAILGNKLTQTYHAGDGYFEVCVDVGSSSVGGGLLKLVKGYLTALTFDMCFVLEAQTEDELPEVSLGQLRFANVDLKMAKKFA